jgi:serine/threonine protein phosphatase PrpC
VITRAIGTQKSVDPDISQLNLRSGDVLLLCSDGLTREVPEEGIAAVLSARKALEDQCRELIDAANAAGGHDNITAILVRST